MSDKQREQAHTSGFGCFWKSLGVLLASVFVCGFGLGGCLMVRHNQHKQQFNMTVERIRVTGEPLDGPGLNSFYRVPQNENDLTSLYLQALAPFLEGQGNQAFWQDARPLPIVGESTTPIPPPGQPWAELEASQALIEKYQTSVDLLHEAGRQQGSVRYPVDFNAGYGALLPHAQAVRSASRFLSLDLQVSLHTEDRTRAVDSLVAMLKVGESLKDEPINISQLVRMAVFGIFVQDLQIYLEHGSPTDEDLARLQAALSEVDFPGALTRALQGERAMAYQTVATSDLKTMQSLSSGGGPTPAVMDWLPKNQTVAQIRPGDSAMVLITLTEMVEASRHPFPKAAEEAAAADARLKAFFAKDQQQLPWDRHVLTQMLLPALSRTFSATAERTATHRASIAMLAVERHRLAHSGQLPERLDDLVPDLLATAPIDPFDGQSLRLVQTENGYVVYSVGPDNKDDQGNVGVQGQKGLDIGLQREMQKAE